MRKIGGRLSEGVKMETREKLNVGVDSKAELRW